mmetsp:Transcript_7503/g.19335  ORF Transcript_7503/g.19335 Transcript_7503/m.19335 type:complete len:372 (+) Transcript_7503:209-1324(+)
MGRRKSFLLRLLPPRKPVGHSAVRYSWQAPGTPIEVLNARREALLKTNLVAHLELREEWTTLIHALDSSLQHEVIRRSSDEDTSSTTSSEADISMSQGGPTPSAPPLFVSEYLDLAEPIQLPRGISPASPDHRQQVFRQSSREHHSRDCPSTSSLSHDRSAVALTEGSLPGTMPVIQLFCERDFSPTETQMDEIKRRPSLTPACRPVLTAVGPRPLSSANGDGSRPSSGKGSTTKGGRAGGRPTKSQQTRRAMPGPPRCATITPRSKVPAARPASAMATLGRSAAQQLAGRVEKSPARAVRAKSLAAHSPARSVHGRTSLPNSPVRAMRAARGPAAIAPPLDNSPWSKAVGRSGAVAVWSTPDVSICGRNG